MLHIFNTQTRNKEPFRPLSPEEVRVYVCGMTVYDYCHVGHARVMVFFDTMVKYFKSLGYAVKYVRNITDIDDKIIQRANENQEPFMDLVARFITAMHEDTERLRIAPPDAEPRATSSIAEIIAMVETLIARKMAYAVETQEGNQDVYFSVEAFAPYGKLSGKNTDDLLAGARVEVGTLKRNPMDFALWKSAKPEEPSWDSPWGQGRPGWHIECSAMSRQHLGDHFDIHGGGMDLIFPHHENEVAQSEGCLGHQHVNTWMHVGFVRVDDEKMSKSLGNFFTIREVLDQYDAEVVRMFLLSSHYRNPLNYTIENLEHAKSALARLYTTLRDSDSKTGAVDATWQAQFQEKMDDDFNTPEALAVLFALAREINRTKDQGKPTTDLATTLVQLATVLGLLDQKPEAFLQASDGTADAEVDAMLLARNAARADKDWARADEIRDQLDTMGVVIEDGANGTSWRRK